MKKQILKAIEEAYRKGLREGNKNKDIMPYLITSQVEAFKIFKAIVGPTEIKQTTIGIEFAMNYIKTKEAKQRLFNLMSDEHNLTLLDGEINDIVCALTKGIIDDCIPHKQCNLFNDRLVREPIDIDIFKYEKEEKYTNQKDFEILKAYVLKSILKCSIENNPINPLVEKQLLEIILEKDVELIQITIRQLTAITNNINSQMDNTDLPTN